MTAKLREEIDYLREQVRQYKDVLRGGLRWPPEWGLTPSESAILGVLVAREVASKQAILIALYADRPDPPADATIRRFVCTLRKKLEDHDVTIHTALNTGWCLARADRARLREMAVR
jgi:two-component system, cell cycle response regulator CtrA